MNLRAIEVGDYVYFDDRSCRVSKILPNGRLEIWVGHKRSGPVTRDVREDQVTTVSTGAVNDLATRGFFGGRGRRVRT